MSSARLSVIVATRDRATYLDAMLSSYRTEWARTGEFLVVDNGSRDDTAEVLACWKRREPRLRSMFVAEPGKSLALNRGIASTSGPHLAFLDDDVLVQPGWAAKLLAAFESSACAGFQGRILLESGARSDPVKAELARRYDLLPITDHGAESCRVGELVGANMAVRRAWLERAGGFDEELGPGRTGFGEDSKLGRDIVALGGELAYIPGAWVEHVYDERRMTEAHFEEHHRLLGRSRFALRQNKLVTRLVLNVVASMIRSRLARWRGAEDAYLRNHARYFAYSEMLRVHRERRREVMASATSSGSVRVGLPDVK